MRQTIQYVLTSYKVPAWKLNSDIQSRTRGCRELRRANNSQRLDPTPSIESVVLKSMLVQNDVFELSDFELGMTSNIVSWQIPAFEFDEGTIDDAVRRYWGHISALEGV